MTATEFLLVVGAFLATWGLLTAWVAHRLGRDAYTWWVIGTVLGPLSVPVLWGLVRSPQPAAFEPVVLGPPPRPGAPRVLVPAADPSGLLAAVPAVRDRLGWLHPTVTLAVVADAEHAPAATATTRGLHDDLDRATPGFTAAQAALGGRPDVCEVLFGGPGRATMAEISWGAPACVVVATKGWPGGRRALARLELASRCPVLVCTRRPTSPRAPTQAPTSRRGADRAGLLGPSATTRGRPR